MSWTERRGAASVCADAGVRHHCMERMEERSAYDGAKSTFDEPP